MATHSYGPGSTTPPNSGSPEWNHAYGIAALRAALIALALLRLRKRNGARDGLWKNPEDLTEHQNAKLSRSSTQRRPTAPVFGQRRRE
ncbi:Uncharacterised protein [Mycobacterium tuberculosis]|nr:Uncharacterised protein [Mycobacterium tuberculosis]CKQ03032.1 Uncharacterised protein [Mycobacterium tuberculosis]